MNSNSRPASQQRHSKRSSAWSRYSGAAAKNLILIFFCVLALAPLGVVVVNSFKTRDAIFNNPYDLPTSETFSLLGYQTVQAQSDFGLYYRNSAIVTLTSLGLILLFGAMISYALAQFKFRGSNLLLVYALIGLIIPIRMGSVSLLRFIVSLNLVNTHLALILIYIAQGLPLAIFVLTPFMRQLPHDLLDAARIDGASELRIFRLMVPLVRPALATVAAFTIIPVWNDLWFPLIIAPGASTRTVTLGAMQFVGQFSSNWNALLAALTIAAVPIILLYLIFSRQLLAGLTSGAIK